ncbi:MAG: hypothetical protein IJ575_03700, partial [Selenomonadaceae bacterium]|nr:hypothetical protein [Selenomonadaceae bacterium]
DGITVSDSGVVTINSGNLNGENVSISGTGYTLALGTGISAPTTTDAHFDGFTYKSSSSTAGYTLSSDSTSIIYSAAVSETNLFILSGVSSTDGITVSDSGVVTINSGNLNGENVSISGTGYTLALGTGITAPTSTDAHFDGFVYKSSSSTAGYTLSSDSTSIIYSAAVSATDLFTLSGVSSTDGITVSDSGVVTINSTNLNGENVSISGTGYTLALGTGINAPVTTDAHFDGFVYKSSSSTAGYTLSSDRTSITYSAAVSETNLFTLSGVSSTDGITVSDSGVVTINSGNLNGENVSISGTGYTLALGTGINAPTTTDAHFDGFTYKSSSSTAGYTLSSDSTSIIYSAAVSETNLFTLSGVSSTDGITVSDSGVVTINSGNLNGETVSISGTGYTLALATNVDGYQVASDGRSIIYSTGSSAGSNSGSSTGSDSGSSTGSDSGSSTGSDSGSSTGSNSGSSTGSNSGSSTGSNSGSSIGSDSGSSTGSDSGSTIESVQGSIIYGSISSIDDYLAPAISDESVGTGSVEGSTVAISWTNLGLAVDTNEVHGSDVDIDQPNSVMINENGEMTAANSTDSDAVISVDTDTNSATLVMNESNRSYNLTFHGGAIVANWNASLSSGNDQLHIGNIKGGHFDGGHGKDYFHVTKNLQGNISLTGGASNEDLDSGNNFYAESNSVSSSSDQSKITITDVNFNATDILLIDAGIENLTRYFFGDSKFYNYATAEDASTDGIYAGTVLDASDLVASIGMSHSMLRMADKSSASVDDENTIDEDSIYNVVWANSNSGTIDFHESQDDEVLIFTNTNSRGDIVSLGGDFNDTIHAGKNDTIDSGGGDDLIYLEGKNIHVIFGSSEGNDTIYGWNSTDYLEFDSIPDVSIVGGNLYLENENGTLLIDGSFTNSTNIRYSDGILRVGDSNGDVIYDRSVNYYVGSNLILDTSRGTSIDLSSSTYENISAIDASNGRGRDVFRYTSDAGNVTISNGDSRDVVDLSSYTIDEISTEFTDSGLIISVDDSSLNIVGTEMTQFSLASGKYTADFNNQTFNS